MGPPGKPTAATRNPIPGTKAEVARVRETLRTIIDVAGLSIREIERSLASEGHGLDLNRMLAGKYELRLHQVLDVLRILEIHPTEFFHLVFKEPPARSPLLERMREIFGALRPPALAPRSSTPGPQPKTTHARARKLVNDQRVGRRQA